MVLTEEESRMVSAHIDALKLEHHDLDDIIHRLSQDKSMDQLRLQRLKKRKLLLKDTINRLSSQLIPDLNA